MGRDELAVEQVIAPSPQARDQIGQRHLRGIWHAGEHAFPKKRPRNRYAV
jgi:hypothetical protein